MGEEVNKVNVIGGVHIAADYLSEEPNAHGEAVGVVEVGVDVVDGPDLYLQAGLLKQLPPGGIPDVLSPFDVAAGDAPLALAGLPAGTSAHQNPLVIHAYHRHSDNRILVLYEAAGGALGAGPAATDF